MATLTAGPRGGAPPLRVVVTPAITVDTRGGSASSATSATSATSVGSGGSPIATAIASTSAASATAGVGTVAWDEGVLARMAAEVDAGVAAQSLAVLVETTARTLQATMRDAARVRNAAGAAEIAATDPRMPYDAAATRLRHDALDRLEAAIGFTLLAAAAVGAIRGAAAAAAVTAANTTTAARPVAPAPAAPAPPLPDTDPLAALVATLGVVEEGGSDDDDGSGSGGGSGGGSGLWRAAIAASAAAPTVAPPPALASPPTGGMGARAQAGGSVGRPGRSLVASPQRAAGADPALSVAKAALARAHHASVSARTVGSQRTWNDAGNGVVSSVPGAAVLNTLHAMGTRLWVNYATLAKRARARGTLLPSAHDLFMDGIRFRAAGSGSGGGGGGGGSGDAGLGAPGHTASMLLDGPGAGAGGEGAGAPRRAGLAATMMGALVRDGKTMAPGLASLARTRSMHRAPDAAVAAAAGSPAEGTTPDLPRTRSRRVSVGTPHGSGGAGSSLGSGDNTGPATSSSMRGVGGTVRAVSTLKRLGSMTGGASALPNGQRSASGLRTLSAFGSPGVLPAGGISMTAFLAASATASTGTVSYVSSVEPLPGSVAAECLFVVMQVARWDAILRRLWRLTTRAAVYRRRLVYLLMLDRVDSEAKVQQRMVDMLAKLHGPRAAADATLALIRSMGPLNRRAFFERLGDEMKSQVVHESAAEAAAAAALVEVARSMCGCAVLRESLVPMVVERVAQRKEAAARDGVGSGGGGGGAGGGGGRMVRLRSNLGRDDAISALLDIADETQAAVAAASTTTTSASPPTRSPGGLPARRLPASPPTTSPSLSSRSLMPVAVPLRTVAWSPAAASPALPGSGGSSGAFTPSRPVAAPTPVAAAAAVAAPAPRPVVAAAPTTESAPAAAAAAVAPAATPAPPRAAAAAAVPDAALDGEAATMSNVRIAREMILMHTELQGARGELEQERARRIAAEAEVARLRDVVRQLQAAARAAGGDVSPR